MEVFDGEDFKEAEKDARVKEETRTRKTLKEEQKRCPDCIEAVQFLYKVPGARRRLWLCKEPRPLCVGGTFCLKSHEAEKEGETAKVILPSALWTAVIHRMHLAPTSRHPRSREAFTFYAKDMTGRE